MPLDPPTSSPFFTREPARHQERILVRDRDDVVADRAVIGGGPEILADTLDQIRPACSAGVHRAFRIGADDANRAVRHLFQDSYRFR